MAHMIPRHRNLKQDEEWVHSIEDAIERATDLQKMPVSDMTSNEIRDLFKLTHDPRQVFQLPEDFLPDSREIDTMYTIKSRYINYIIHSPPHCINMPHHNI